MNYLFELSPKKQFLIENGPQNTKSASLTKCWSFSIYFQQYLREKRPQMTSSVLIWIVTIITINAADLGRKKIVQSPFARQLEIYALGETKEER